METLAELLQKYPNGFPMPDHLRPPEMLPKPPPCKYCDCGYIIPEPTEEELKSKAQEEKIQKQQQTIDTLLAHLAKLTDQVNQITLKTMSPL